MSLFSKISKCEKLSEDIWTSSPPQVTTLLTFSKLTNPTESSTVTHVSPLCGFGWHFQIVEKYSLPKPENSQPRPIQLRTLESPRPSQPTANNAPSGTGSATDQFSSSLDSTNTKPLVGTIQLSFHPPPSSPITTTVTIQIRITYPGADVSSHLTSHEREYHSLALKSLLTLGSFEDPPQYKGQPQIAITVIFPVTTTTNTTSPDGFITFQTTTPHSNTYSALCDSLEDPCFVDTKFYLFSAKRCGWPVRPKPIYAKSKLLVSSSAYLKSLLSTDLGFNSGTPCNLNQDSVEEIAKLTAERYDYDSDSDLDSLPDDDGGGDGDDDDHNDNENGFVEQLQTLNMADGSLMKEKEASVSGSSTTTEGSKQVAPLSPTPSDGRAYAINATAHKTWKAFILYIYTNNVQFSSLKSENKKNDAHDSETVKCSPKSMYRFADYADIPKLKAVAKEGIRQRLSKTNIVQELFSSFTSNYQEIIEMEVSYFLKEFNTVLAQQLDEILQLVVVGEKPHSYRVLVYLMRRQRGETSKAAWKALANSEVGGLFSFSPKKDPFWSYRGGGGRSGSTMSANMSRGGRNKLAAVKESRSSLGGLGGGGGSGGESGGSNQTAFKFTFRPPAPSISTGDASNAS